MRKYKCNPSKPGWYLAWFDGVELNIGDDILDCRNAYEWNGEVWKNHLGYASFFFDPEYMCWDRWSYLPKGHPKKEKKVSRKKVTPQGLYI